MNSPADTSSSSAASFSSREPLGEPIEHTSHQRQSFDTETPHSVRSASPSRSPLAPSSTRQTAEQPRSSTTSQPLARGRIYQDSYRHQTINGDHEALNMQHAPRTPQIFNAVQPVRHGPISPLRRVSKRDFATMLHGENDDDVKDQYHRHHVASPPLPLVALHRSSQSPSPKRRRLHVQFRDQAVTQTVRTERMARVLSEQVRSELFSSAAGYTGPIARIACNIDNYLLSDAHVAVGSMNMDSRADSCAIDARVTDESECADALQATSRAQPEVYDNDALHDEVLQTMTATELNSMGTHAQEFHEAACMDTQHEHPMQNIAWSALAPADIYDDIQMSSHGIWLLSLPPPFTEKKIDIARFPI